MQEYIILSLVAIVSILMFMLPTIQRKQKNHIKKANDYFDEFLTWVFEKEGRYMVFRDFISKRYDIIMTPIESINDILPNHIMVAEWYQSENYKRLLRKYKTL